MSYGIWCVPLRPRPATERYAADKAGWLLDASPRGIVLYVTIDRAREAARREASIYRPGPWTFTAKPCSDQARWDDSAPR